MSGIFVTKEDMFDVALIYKLGGKKVEILKEMPKVAEPTKDAEGKDVVVPVDQSINTMTVTFRRPDFGAVQNILRASTVMQEGMPVVNIMAMQTAVLLNLMVSWDAKDEKGDAVELTNSSVGSLRPELARALIDKMYEALGPDAIVL